MFRPGRIKSDIFDVVTGILAIPFILIVYIFSFFSDVFGSASIKKK